MARSPSKLFTVCDIGTDSVRILTGQVNDLGFTQNDAQPDYATRIPYNVLGIGVHSCKGAMDRGRVRVSENLRSAIGAAWTDMMQQGDNQYGDKLHIGFPGSNTIIANETISLRAFQRADHTITEQDVQELTALVRERSNCEGQLCIESILGNYILDRDMPVDDALDRMAGQLSRSASYVRSAQAPTSAIVRDISESFIHMSDIAPVYHFSAMAAGDVALTDAEREQGVLLIDFGEGTTSWCFWRNRRPQAGGSIPIGVVHWRADLKAAFALTDRQAVDLLQRASIMPAEATMDIVEALAETGMEPRRARRHDVMRVLDARVREVLTVIHGNLAKEGLENYLARGVRLVGGGAHLRGLPELAAEIFRTDATLPSFYIPNGIPDAMRDCASIAPLLGLAQFAARDIVQNPPKERSPWDRVKGFFYGKDGE